MSLLNRENGRRRMVIRQSAFRFVVLALFTLTADHTSAQKEVSLTIYNQDLGLVKEIRTLDFARGRNRIQFTDVASAIDPTSVRFRALEHPESINLLEQNYQFDLVNSEKILSRYVDKSIQAIAKDGKVFEGTLLSVSPGSLVLQEPSGGLRIVSRDNILDIAFPALPEGLFTRPTLLWLIDAETAGKRKAEVSYLTSAINWHAEYVATVDATDTNLELAGWVSIDNRSGAGYADAKVKLIAGEIHRAEAPRPRYAEGLAMEQMAKAPAFAEEAFFEYHLYTLQRPATVANNEIKQISLFEPAQTPVKKIFTFEGQRRAKVNVTLEFVNAQARGLGMPLPAGKIRVMKKSADGGMEFVGEDMIDHTPKDEKVRIEVGSAFDLVGERKVKDRRQISDRVWEEDYEISLRNRKAENVEIVVTEHLYGYWEIRNASSPYTKKDANTVEFPVKVPAGAEVVLTYTARFRS